MDRNRFGCTDFCYFAGGNMGEYLRREAQRFLRNIHSAAPLVVFRRSRFEDFHFSLDQAAWLVLFQLTLAFGISYLLSLPDPQFNVFGLSTATQSLAGALLVGFVIGKIVRDDSIILKYLILEYSTTLYFYALWVVFTFGERMEFLPVGSTYLAYYGFMAWSLGVSGFIIFQFCGKQWRILLPGYASYLVLAFLPALFINSGEFWYKAQGMEGDADAVYRPINEEDVYYAQYGLMDQLVSGLVQGREGVTDVYFIGFAGDASEDVFMKEAWFAQQTADERLDTHNRSLLLINNRKTMDSMPLATSHNLATALNYVGEVMQPGEDVLFLYLTSHGAQDDGLAVDFQPLNLNMIGAEDLKQALDDSGIKWRVLLISACYSGQFVDALKDDFTLVMTASAADRTSFGCDSKSEFTYFGKAVFDEQLRIRQPLLEALEGARRSITEREQRERQEPSYPQLFVGAAMREKLGELDRRLLSPSILSAQGLERSKVD